MTGQYGNGGTVCLPQAGRFILPGGGDQRSVRIEASPQDFPGVPGEGCCLGAAQFPQLGNAILVLIGSGGEDMLPIGAESGRGDPACICSYNDGLSAG